MNMGLVIRRGIHSLCRVKLIFALEMTSLVIHMLLCILML